MTGDGYIEHDGHALGEGLARRLREGDTDGSIGSALYADMTALQERNRANTEDDAVTELDDPASLFDHARGMLRRLSGHAADDVARVVVERDQS